MAEENEGEKDLPLMKEPLVEGVSRRFRDGKKHGARGDKYYLRKYRVGRRRHRDCPTCLRRWYGLDYEEVSLTGRSRVGEDGAQDVVGEGGVKRVVSTHDNSEDQHSPKRSRTKSTQSSGKLGCS